MNPALIAIAAQLAKEFVPDLIDNVTRDPRKKEALGRAAQAAIEETARQPAPAPTAPPVAAPAPHPVSAQPVPGQGAFWARIALLVLSGVALGAGIEVFDPETGGISLGVKDMEALIAALGLALGWKGTHSAASVKGGKL